jgi:hypothetical protein
MSSDPARMAERMRMTLDLFDLAEAMQRQRLKRKHPHASDAEIDDLVNAWLQRRPGAELGDAEGRSVTLPRTPA